MKQDYQIPFDSHGLQSYPWERAAGFHWIDNRVFKVNLWVAGYYRGQSAAGLRLEDINGQRYQMFMHDFKDVIRECVIDKGWIYDQEWTFCKRGGNYGLRLNKEKNAD